MANITKRGDSYLIRVSAGRTVGGKQIFKSKTYKPEAKTPKAIEKELAGVAADFEKQVHTGKYLSGEQLRFYEYIEIWKTLPSVMQLSQKVKEDYESVINKKFIPAFGNMRMVDINANHLNEIYIQMIKDGRADATIKKCHAVASTIFKKAFKSKTIPENICLYVDIPKQRKKGKDEKMHCFTNEEAGRFLEALKMSYVDIYKPRERKSRNGAKYKVSGYSHEVTIPLQFQVYFNIALYSGFRRSEMVALTWNDVDFDNNCISVCKSISNTKKYGQIVKGPKTAAGYRDILLPSSCMDLLKVWKKKQLEMSIAYGNAWRGLSGKDFDDNFIFIGDMGNRMHVDTPSKKFKEIITRYNNSVKNESDQLPYIRLHDLRHTSATLLISQNVDIRTVANRLGHSKTSVTLDIYSHALKETDSKAVDALEKIIKKHN